MFQLVGEGGASPRLGQRGIEDDDAEVGEGAAEEAAGQRGPDDGPVGVVVAEVSPGVEVGHPSQHGGHH